MDDAAQQTVLDDPVRRALYRLILEADAPISRNEAAEALGLPVSTVTAHLARMAHDGALITTSRRASGRSGPGSGRPTVFYAPAAAEVSLSVPPRQYELMGDILAGAIATTAEQQPALVEVLRDAARRRGRELGESAGGVQEALDANGFEPIVEDGELRLGNCPFHQLSRRHTGLVCPLNGALLEGILEGTGEADAVVAAVPDGSPCCARIGWPSRAGTADTETARTETPGTGSAGTDGADTGGADAG
jgi:predicted ArsR family transcriptional regulator